MVCTKCGWNNLNNAQKCANCSADLTNATPPQQTQQMQQQPQQPYYQPPQQPYAQQYQPGRIPMVPDYMVWSIIATAVSAILGVKCCVSLIATGFGIVAIVKSSQANSKKSFGDYAGAMLDAESAKTWLYWSVGVWAGSVILTIIAVILYFVGMASVFSHMPGSHGFQ